MKSMHKISEENLITLKTRQYDINNLSLYYDDQRITFNGKIDENPDENLFISIINFDVENLNPLITKRLDGVFNGFIDIKDYFRNREINSRINVKDFSINEFLVGNVIAFSEYDNTENKFDVNLNINMDGHIPGDNRLVTIRETCIQEFTKDDEIILQWNFVVHKTNRRFSHVTGVGEELIRRGR